MARSERFSNHVGASLDFLVQSLQRVCAVQLGPVLLGEVQMRQNVGLAVVNERRELRPLLPQLIGHVTQRLAGLCAIRVIAGSILARSGD